MIVPISRRYEPGTLVIETTWVTETGWVVVRDALTPPAAATEHARHARTASTKPSTLLRTIDCLDGEVEMEMECVPCFDYGREQGAWGSTGAGTTGDGAPAGATR